MIMRLSMFNGQKLREIRELHQLTQKKAAALFNISPSTLSHYENGNREPSSEFLIKYSNHFNISKEELVSLLFDTTLHDPNVTYHTTPEQELVFEIIDDKKLKELPLSEKIKIREYAHYIYTQFKKKSK